jgi:hypothetical protein
MFVLSRSTKRLLAVGSTTALFVVPWAPAFAGNSNDKQTICHATRSNTNPYVVNTPNKNGDVGGHAKHTGPVWTPTLKALHLRWGDIIPPFDYNDHGTAAQFPGMNWDANGQAWFANDCRVPITGQVDKTNDANGDATFSDDETATAEGASVPFTVVVTNTSVVPAVVTSLLDTVGGASLAITPTPDPVGTVLAPGASISLTFTAADYSPPDGGVAVNVITVGLARSGDPSNNALVEDSSTVRTAVPTTPPPVTPPTGGGGGGEFTGGGGGPTTLPRTGRPIELTAASAVAMLLAGMMLVLLAPRRRPLA